MIWSIGTFGQFFDLPAGPCNFERLDFGALSQAKMNARIAGRHVTPAALCLFDVDESFGSQFQRCADAVAVGFCSDQLNLEPVIGIAAVVAQEGRIVAAIVGDDVDVAVIVVSRRSRGRGRR